MTSAFARFQRQQKQPPQQQQQQTAAVSDARVGEILSDSSSTLSSADERRARPSHPDSRLSDGDSDARAPASARRSTRETSGGRPAAKIRQLPARRVMKKTGSRKWYSDSEDDADSAAAPVTTALSEKQQQQPADKEKRSDGRRHKGSKGADPRGRNADDENDESGDAEEEEEEEAVRSAESDASDLAEPPASINTQRKALKSLKALNTAALSAAHHPQHQVASPTSESDAPPRSGTLDPLAVAAKKKTATTGFQKLVAKTFSPFGSRRKSVESPAALSSPHSSGDPATAIGRAQSTAVLSPAASSDPAAALRASDSRKRQPVSSSSAGGGKRQSGMGDVASPLSSSKGSRGTLASQLHAEAPLINRRTSRLKQPPGSAELSSAPRSVVDSPRDAAAARRALEAAVAASGGSTDAFSGSEALSPGQRKVPGAFLGAAGSGVLLEGWLRQKQRRGVKGMKRWNARYFVLYAKSNEVRYYADVVPSAWGPIPLGEIGSISLRLIQKISKPGHPKYRGCRFDITCRNSWGTHYADDYVSSDDENSNNTNNNTANDTTTANADAAATAKQERTSTPRSSRMYSLVADSPQTTVTWMSALDSLLVRSANSPRPDVSTGTGATAGATAPGSGGARLKRVASAKAVARRRSSTLESETLVLVGAADNVPKPVAFAVKYIFDSTPGIETPLFYESEPDAAKLKTSLKFLNQFSTDAARTPSMEELEAVLDPVTAGAVVKTWLKQLAQPLVPFEMFDDFQALARSAAAAPFALARDLKALVESLPRRNFAMLVCVLVHLNDVHGYASKNGMDAAVLAARFAEFVLRPRDAESGGAAEGAGCERELTRALVEEMIANVDAIVDEKAVEEFGEGV
ncbi:hypothetical protein PybrP1_008578 [[Pythium] brassicae (nom. inval.)]|nr:hypothetical protein PybrP1_008578 [[Pythium] brassicae (nom. inval.)]